MQTVDWLLLILLSFTAGICLLQFLVTSPRRMPVWLAAGPLQKLLVFPASFSAASIHSDILIPEQVARAHLPLQVEVINLGAWGNDPCLVAALKEQVSSVLEERKL